MYIKSRVGRDSRSLREMTTGTVYWEIFFFIQSKGITMGIRMVRGF